MSPPRWRRSLEKLPADRFATAREFADALTNPAYRTSAVFGVAAAPAAPPSRVPLLLTGALIAAVALLAWRWPRRTPELPTTRVRIALSKHPLAPGSIGSGMALSPDGATIVFADTAGGTRRLWLKSPDQPDAEPLTGTEGAWTAAFSPDGEWIAFIADGRVRKVPRAGGSAVTIADSAGSGAVPPDVAWLDNGTVAYTDQRFGLSLVGEDGGPARRFDYLATVGMGVASIGPLRGGHAVLLGMCNWGCPSANLFVADLATGKLDSLIDGAVRGWQLTDGRVVFARPDGGVFAARFDAGRHRFTSSPTPVLDGVRTVQYWPDMALAPNGTLLYAVGAAGGGNVQSQAVWVTRDGRAAVVDSGLVYAPSTNAGIRLSPDGRRVAIGVVSDGREEVWIKQLDHGPFVRLTLEGPAVRPEWSRDSRDVFYFAAGRANDNDLRRRRADGSGGAEVLLHGSRAAWELQPMRDTSRFIVRLGVPPTRDIYLFDRTKGAGDSAITPLVADDRYEEVAVALSPDERWLAYGSNESGRFEVYVRPFPNVNAGRWQVSGAGGNEPRWSHTGRELFYRRADGELMSVTVAPGGTFDPGTQRALFPAAGYIENPSYSNYDVSPDDQRFIFSRPIATAVHDDANTAILVEHWLAHPDAPRTVIP